MFPEGGNVDPGHLGALKHFAEGPHERPIDPQQLPGRDLHGRSGVKNTIEKPALSLCSAAPSHLVRLVEDDSDLVVVPAEALDDFLEFIRDVELVRVEEEQDKIGALSKPPTDLLVTMLQGFGASELHGFRGSGPGVLGISSLVILGGGIVRDSPLTCRSCGLCAAFPQTTPRGYQSASRDPRWAIASPQPGIFAKMRCQRPAGL
jgi:hypothetical protein